MPRSCSVCESPRVVAIDAQLRAGEPSLRQIAARHGVSPTTLRRHRAHVAPLRTRNEVAGSNRLAAEAVVQALADSGRLEERHRADVAHVLDLAGARDAQPASAALAREYRLALAQLLDRVDEGHGAGDVDAINDVMVRLHGGWSPDEREQRWRAVADACIAEGLAAAAAGRVAEVATADRTGAARRDGRPIARSGPFAAAANGRGAARGRR
jgi:hypothetical protein